MRSLIPLAAICLMLAASGDCAVQSPETEAAAIAELRVGEHYLDASATAQALPELTRIVRDYPGTRAAVIASYRIAYCHAFEGRHEQAMALAHDVIATSPGTCLVPGADRDVAGCPGAPRQGSGSAAEGGPDERRPR